MNGRTSPPETPDYTPPAPVHPRIRYRYAFRISLGISAVLHVVAIAMYSGFFSGIPVARFDYGGPLQLLTPQGTELVNLLELPDEPEPDTPPAPEELAPEVPEIPIDAGPTGIVAPPGVEERAVGPEGPTAAERIRPKEGDLRFWAPPDPARTALSREELMRLQLIARLETLNDSAALAAELAAQAQDWTYTDDEGKKWGISPGKLHLGDLTLPMPSFGMSPWERQRAEERLWAWDAIERSAASGALLRSWKDRDQAIRERKNAERKPDTTRTGGGGLSPAG